jgi:hypothetical protein
MFETFLLAGTESHVRFDWDKVNVSFGPDTSEVHCWSCTASDMGSGAFMTKVQLPDGRSTWEDFSDRYDYPNPDATRSLICLDCALKYDPNAKFHETVEQRAQAKAATYGMN